ncbi:UNVERIFIED_CONTAM: hypothetical protein PYX00_004914 [Menopon gallinae]|uniref:Transmembrane protein 14C n=1 Tax=Menopon gallinae TaxID=328185 RepID=A0AAW2I789_9NEOP
MAIDYIGFAYAATITAGGIMGYVKAQSTPSLAAGLFFGGLLGFGAFQMSRNPNNYHVALGTSSLLTVLMIIRYWNCPRFMPAGCVAIISAANVIRLSTRILLPTKEAET